MTWCNFKIQWFGGTVTRTVWVVSDRKLTSGRVLTRKQVASIANKNLSHPIAHLSFLHIDFIFRDRFSPHNDKKQAPSTLEYHLPAKQRSVGTGFHSLAGGLIGQTWITDDLWTEKKMISKINLAMLSKSGGRDTGHGSLEHRLL